MKHSRGVKVAAGVIVALPFIAIVLYVVMTATSGGPEDSDTSDPVESAGAPRMTDEEYEQLRAEVNEIHPAIIDQGTRRNARDTCSSLDSDRLIHNTIVRFSNAEHDVTEAEAEEIAQAVRDIGFCGR